MEFTNYQRSRHKKGSYYRDLLAKNSDQLEASNSRVDKSGNIYDAGASKRPV